MEQLLEDYNALPIEMLDEMHRDCGITFVVSNGRIVDSFYEEKEIAE